MGSDSAVLRVGMVNFVNTAPLMLPFRAQELPPFLKAVEDVPTNLNRMLKDGQVDAGLVSSFFYGQNHDGLVLMDGFCISATGTVGSVNLYSRVPIYELSGCTIALTSQSATSINLLYIILEHFNRLSPAYVTGSFDMVLEGRCQAYLAIGDEALKLNRSDHGLFSYDLASIWYETTSLPFVFAVWAARRESYRQKAPLFRQFEQILERCYRQGQKMLSDIAARVCGRIPMSSYECLSYLKGIEFDLSPEKRKGLRHFFMLLKEMGRLEDLPRIPGPEGPECDNKVLDIRTGSKVA